jgi:transcriptional regulator with XRE-family HTH domain
MTGQWLRPRQGGLADAGDDAGATIREYRLAVGWTQVDVAASIGITQQHLSQIEKGKSPVTFDLRRKFAALLNIPASAVGLSDRVTVPAARQETAGSPGVSASRGRWRAERTWLNQHRFDLAKVAVGLYAPESRVAGTTLITAPGWLMPCPLLLRSVRLELDEEPRNKQVTGREQASSAVRPLRSRDAVFDSYTAAIKHIDPPALLENRPCYRLLECAVADKRLKFGLAAYFDKLDISEALGHEIAALCMPDGIQVSGSDLQDKLPLRQLIGDPFDLQRRAVVPAITTLTVRLRRYPAAPSFLLHWRNPAAVATAGGVYDVIPAGEFQPSSVVLWDRRNDFDLWRNIIREYSEELLGAPEHDGTRTEPIDYADWPLYQALEEAQRAGTVTAFLLGVGLDALTLAATILTVVVIDDDVFDAVFGQTVRFNEEGEIVGIGDGRPVQGIPFTAEAVTRMLHQEPMAAPGAACLALAWQHREALLL